MTGTSVRPAVTLMYVGAAITMARLIFGVVLLSIDFDGGGGGTMLGRSVTTSPNRGGVILGWSVFGLVSVALWLWMARANGRGRRWARVMSTVLFGLATLTLANGLLPGSPAGDGAAVVLLYYGGGAMLAAEWLTGLAAVWLLWRPDSSAFFQSVPLPPDSPVRSYARWSFAWAVSLALLGLSYLLFRVVRGLILLGYPWWWWLMPSSSSALPGGCSASYPPCCGRGGRHSGGTASRPRGTGPPPSRRAAMTRRSRPPSRRAGTRR